MADILARIIEGKKNEVAGIKSSTSQAEFEARIDRLEPPRDFIAALIGASLDGYGLIAEIKKASPSAGVIRADFNPTALAQAYEEGGANCLSVLTDMNYFHGQLGFIELARNATDLPVLRKDFIIDPIQVYQSRAFGADAILIILAAVDDSLALDLEAVAHSLGMAVLVEVHNYAELERSQKLRSPLLGINNRNLQTMQTDLGTAESLLAKFPAGRIAVAESGLKTPDDLARMAQAGARVFLIGEHLMKADNVAAATKNLLANPIPRHSVSRHSAPSESPNP